MWKRTLTIVSRMLTDPKTALAGVILETSFARFMASMAIFNEERAPSRPFGRLSFASIVGTQGSGENTVLREAMRKIISPDRDRRPSSQTTCKQSHLARCMRSVGHPHFYISDGLRDVHKDALST